MASRWMQQVKARDRAYRRKLGNSSITVTERKFERRKVTIGKNGFIVKVETLDEHLERMYALAREEQFRPKEPTRVLARLFDTAISEMPLNADEKKIIFSYIYRPQRQDGTPTGEVLLRPDVSIADVEKSILRYRRLTGRKPEPKLSLGERRERFNKKMLAQQKPKNKKTGKPQVKTFSFPD